MRAVRMVMVVTLGLLGTSVVGAPAEAANKPKADQTKSVTTALRIEKKLRATPIEGGTSYYCAVGSFVSFNDVAGFAPTLVEFEFFGDASEFIGPAPYDDKAAADGIAFPPVGAKHQTQIGDFTYSQGAYATPEAAAANCEAIRATVDGFFGPTATVVYEHTEKCKRAIGKLDAAKDKVKKAKKKVENTTGPAHVAAVKALKDAKAKAKKAKKKYKRACK